MSAPAVASPLAGRRHLSVVDTVRGAIAAVDRQPLPAWATPIAVASLAMYVVLSLDHGIYRSQPPLSLILSASLAILFISLYVALSRPAQRMVTVGQRRGTAILIGYLAINTLFQAATVGVPHLLKNQRYTNDAVAVTDCAAQMVLHGSNPYKNVHMLTCLQDRGLSYGSTTPITHGAFWKFRSYPSPGAKTFPYVQKLTFHNDLLKDAKARPISLRTSRVASTTPRRRFRSPCPRCYWAFEI
jgi:hypothetical protein